MNTQQVLKLLMGRTFIDGKPISGNQLAELSGADQPTIHRILSGKISEPRAKSLQPLADYFGVSLAQLRGEAPLGEASMRKLELADPAGQWQSTAETAPILAPPRRVPVVGTAQLGDNGIWCELEYPVGHGDGHLEFPSRDSQAYALRCRGDSMSPRIKDGEFVIVEPNTAPMPGDEVLVKATDGRVMVKVLLYQREGRVHLMSINEAHPPQSIPLEQVDKIHFVAAIVKKALWREG